LSVIDGTKSMACRDDRFAAWRMHAAFGAAYERIGKLRRAGSRRAARGARAAGTIARIGVRVAAGSLGAPELFEKPLAREENKYQQEKLAHELTTNRRSRKSGSGEVK
jgi:hypothetical protein